MAGFSVTLVGRIEVTPEVVSASAALLTPMIAVVALYIAWQQHRTNRNQFRLALLEKRLKIFNGAAELIGKVLRLGRIESEDLSQFLWETRESDFLFGPDIADYLKEVYGKAADVHVFGEPVTEEQREHRKAAILWFSGQGEELKGQFSKYMAFKEPD